MAYTGYKLERTGDNVKDLLDKIEDLQEATQQKSGTMRATDKQKLDGIGSLSQSEIDECTNF